MHRIDKTKIPRHVAIIMDGNGRWAKKHSLKRIIGHRKGSDAVRSVVKASREIGIQYLTLYAFSVENWSRPKSEVEALMDFLENYLRSELSEMMDNDIRLMTIGNIAAMPEKVKKVLHKTIEETAHNSSMVLNLALSYGGRDEILHALKQIIHDSQEGKIREADITKETFSRYLYTAEIPDPDLLIRTSGEYRISNFLLWQSAYTELYFTNVLWPDFTRESFIEAIIDYQCRERRFGLTSEQLNGI